MGLEIIDRERRIKLREIKRADFEGVVKWLIFSLFFFANFDHFEAIAC